MRVEELMIGNYVLLPDNNIGSVYAIEPDRVGVMISQKEDCDYFTYDDIKPIPISKKILIENEWFEKEEGLYINKRNNFQLEKFVNAWILYDLKQNKIIGNLYNIHELQNIFSLLVVLNYPRQGKEIIIL